MPIPDSAIVCGLLPALSVIATVPNRLPVAVGINVMLIVQVPPAGTLVGQFSICAKSPVAATLEIVSAALPVLVSVID